MSSYDIIVGVRPTHDDQVKLWGGRFQVLHLLDSVPPVDGQNSYSIELRGAGPPRYVLIQSCTIVDVDACTPKAGCPVFSKWGGPPDEENPVVRSIRSVSAVVEKGRGRPEEDDHV